MRPLVVVVPHELRQHRSQMLFVEYDDVVKALSAQGPDHSLGDGIPCVARIGVVMASMPIMRTAVIVGDNGHGKSALFDAITYALFGQHRGGKPRALLNQESRELAVRV